MAISPETSSQNGDVGGYRLRRFMLKTTISPETSSQNGHVEIGREIFGSAKMGLPPETSSKKWDVEKGGGDMNSGTDSRIRLFFLISHGR